MPSAAARQVDAGADRRGAGRSWNAGVGGDAQRRLVRELDARGLTRRRDAPGLIHLAAHLVLLAATASLVQATAGSAWRLPAMLLHGVALVFLFAPLHECIHFTAFRRRWLNHAVAWPAGFLLLLPPRWFRWFHLAHHRYTQDPARDPELAVPKPASAARWLRHVSGLPYWGSQARLLWSLARGRVEGGFVPVARRAGVVAEARVFLAGYALVAVASVAAGTDAVLWYWLLPAVLGQPFLRLYLLAEHTGCPQVPDMLANTRTTLTLPPLRWLAWNMPWHVEHHVAPAVPFHALPAVHGLVGAHATVIGRGYARVSVDIARRAARGG